jgi:N,N'-diacetyllegionaminate synthase
MEGSIDLAIKMVHDAADAGAWGIKTQLLRPETIATSDAPKYWDDDLGTTNQREAFSRAGLIGYGEWGAVREAARSRHLAFVATPFDLEAVDALEAIDVDAYKIASGDLLYVPLLKRVVETGRPIFLSTGAAWLDEVDTIIELMLRWDPSVRYRLIVLACSLVYPTPLMDANIGRIGRLRELFAERGWSQIRVGYSDHTTGVGVSREAAAAGAILLEKHYTYRDADGPVADHSMAVDPDGLAEVVREANAGARIYGDELIVPSEAEERARAGARRACYLTRSVEAGEYVLADDVRYLRPSPYYALPPNVFDEMSDGGIYVSSKKAGDFLTVNDVFLSGSTIDHV